MARSAEAHRSPASVMADYMAAWAAYDAGVVVLVLMAARAGQRGARRGMVGGCDICVTGRAVP